MSEILTSTLTILLLLAGLAALVRWARHDAFVGSGAHHYDGTDGVPAVETGRRFSAP